ncbi:hypothetical protein [Sphingobacterium sp. LRF_L2]|uniref:hypothetical protein n=1 Tax=Sphingobacterium sp. LRF_L2 TaxID=3369421 RepID=UPI003F6224D7
MKRAIFVFLGVAVILLTSCSKDSVPLNDTVVVEETDIALPTLAVVTYADVTTTSAKITGLVTEKGGALVNSRGICWSKSPNPTIEDAALEATSVKGSGEFSVQLSNLNASTDYYLRAYAKNKGGIAYSEEIILRTADVQTVEFANAPMFIIGSSRASYDVEVLSSGGGEITELGVCWGESEHPTVDDGKVVHSSAGIGKFRVSFDGLTERTNYYLRAYAINETGVNYGESISFRTIGKGNVTYTFNKVDNPTADQLAAYARLQVAIDSAVWYANNYTSATKHVWLNYDTGVATADANNEGWMRFGASSTYQNIRTMLHEMNHTFGTGTTSWWWNDAISNGTYQLTNATQMVKYIDGSDAAINGDSQHWWPYGLNQNSEVSSSWDYVYNCLIIEAMRKDGMTSHSGAHLP